MTERADTRFAPERRRVLASIGLATGFGTLAGIASAQSEDGLVLRQGSRCIPVTPLSGSEPVEDLYDYRIPERYAGTDNGGSDPGEGPYYDSAGTRSLQSPDSSILFLYDGPGGVSLVIVHGNVGDDSGGAVTFRLEGLPDSGRWVVKDDYYVNRGTGQVAGTNYDTWQLDGEPATVDWTWGPDRTDGGAFRGLDGGLPVTITPAFNEEATLYGERYDGTVRRWELLTGSRPSPQRVALDLSQPIRIERGTCGAGDGTDTGTGDGSGTDGGGDDDSRDTDPGGEETREERRETKHEKKQRKRKRKHQRKQRKHRKKHERKQRKQRKKHEKKQRKRQRKHERKQRKHQKEKKEEEEAEDD